MRISMWEEENEKFKCNFLRRKSSTQNFLKSSIEYIIQYLKPPFTKPNLKTPLLNIQLSPLNLNLNLKQLETSHLSFNLHIASFPSPPFYLPHPVLPPHPPQFPEINYHPNPNPTPNLRKPLALANMSLSPSAPNLSFVHSPFHINTRKSAC